MRPKIGVIEGFYGQPWSAEDRELMASWLPALGFDYYLYAPKADPHLRRRWQDPWPRAARDEAAQLASRCARQGLQLAIGLSPFALYRDYGAAQRRALRERVEQIDATGAPLLALLFDDMPGDSVALAQRQGDIIQDVATWSGAGGLLVCPTYYSDDPVLDRVFGQRPENYLAELGALLPEGGSLFWTGPRVCSSEIVRSALPTEAQRGGADLALWDNYPVNDSESRSGHLYVQPLTGRSADLAAGITSHWSNGMNQAALSLPAFASLAALYGRPQEHRDAVFEDAGLSEDLLGACEPLAEKCLEELTTAQRERLERSALGPGPASREVAAFLAGAYRFDPSCLTD